MEKYLNISMSALKGVGEKRIKLYKKLGVDNIYSLLCFYPRKYINLSSQLLICDTILDSNNIVKAVVYKKQGEQRIRKDLSIFKVFISDNTSNITITIFNSKFMFDSLKEGEEYIFYGKITGSILKREMISPFFIPANSTDIIRPIYSLTEGLSNNIVQQNIKEAIAKYLDISVDPLPDYIRKKYNLCQLSYAIENIHFPKDNQSLEIAKYRLCFEELLTLHLGLIHLRESNKFHKSEYIKSKDINEIIKSLPFTLTDAQMNAINNCIEDCSKSIPMNRLLQGDVGSGKTMVAMITAYLASKNGYQTAVMAPTQILAKQHYDTFCTYLDKLGVRMFLLTSNCTKKQRETAFNQIENGEIDILIGTHSLLNESLVFKNLLLVITDEQHRFGVSQRALIKSKGDSPHFLIMSATPIPRTLSLMLYGDLDISILDEMPAKRQKIDTFCVSSSKRLRALKFIKEQVDSGRQAFIVCPLIDDSESDLISVNSYKKALEQTVLSSYKIQTIHGKLKSQEKEKLMEEFRDNKIQILISTTVIEVGIDVPNATVMLIENAERFGLAQLHQLRGRVGRGSYKSYCILISDNQGEESKLRLKIMVSTNDGFVIANEDLKLRGPGDFFSQKQHGIPTLKIANFIDDIVIVKETNIIAKQILNKDKQLSDLENSGLKFLVEKLFGNQGEVIMN